MKAKNRNLMRFLRKRAWIYVACEFLVSWCLRGKKKNRRKDTQTRSLLNYFKFIVIE